VLLAASRSQRVRVAVARRLNAIVAVLRRWARREPSRSADVSIDAAIERFASQRLDRRATASAIALAGLNWTTDAACFVACIAAVGAPVPWAQLAVVYATGIGAATLSPTPAGIGIVEATMAVALINAGLPVALAVPAAIAYRAVSCWLALAIGWVVYALARKSEASSNTCTL